ncbi:hypothetical protein BC629DRAFT_1525900 [Irpex lacteus]|nr:hypothetical protein BC629DRAFT_1525900 [Irpex lacteus]
MCHRRFPCWLHHTSLEAFGVALLRWCSRNLMAGLQASIAFICVVIIYGDRLRAWIDLGWSTQQNN